MPHIILLPGNSLKNKAWADTWSQAFIDKGFTVSTQYYDHWNSGAEFADVSHEIEKLEGIAKGAKGDYVIVAKSIGSFITMKAMVLGKVHPTQCVFFGFPVPWLEKNGHEPTSIISQYSKTRTTIFQNNQDPIAPFEMIRSLFIYKSNVSCIELIDNTHNYFAESALVTQVCEIISK